MRMLGRTAGWTALIARKKIVEDFEREGVLLKTEDYPHMVGHCYRCKTIVEPNLSLQWFVKTKPLAERAIEAVKDGRTRIIPSPLGEDLFRMDGEYPGLVYLPADLVGPPDSCLVLRAMREVIVAKDHPRSAPDCGSIV